jgi:hypothetical protein
MSGFAHRPNNDGSVDSICLRCFRTIVSNNHDRSLATVESQHECDPVDLMRFGHLEIDTIPPINADPSHGRSPG